MNVTGHTTPDPHNNAPVPPVAGVSFSDRRALSPTNAPVIERRQFANTHSELSEEARRLGTAIDQYKLVHRRRFITYEEMLGVIKSIGYRLET